MKNVATKAPAAPENARRNGSTANTANTTTAASNPETALTRTDVSNGVGVVAAAGGGVTERAEPPLWPSVRSVSASRRSISSSE